MRCGWMRGRVDGGSECGVVGVAVVASAVPWREPLSGPQPRRPSLAASELADGRPS